MNKTTTYTERTLVLGGNGFIGSNLVARLNDLGQEVTVLHRPGADLGNLDGLDYRSATADLTDLAALERDLPSILKGCDTVYNLAACGTSLAEHAELRRLINIEAARIVAWSAKKAGVPTLVYISSSAAVGFPLHGELADEQFAFNAHHNHYSMTKRQGEQVVFAEANDTFKVVVAIPCSTMGSRGMKRHQLDLFTSITTGRARIYPPGGLCLTDVNDLVRGIVLCSQKGQSGQRYILGGNNITYRSYFNEIAAATGGRAPWLRLPKTLLPLMGSGVETISRLLGRENTIDRHVGRMIAANLFYSSAKAKQELGYTITDWRQSIHDTVAALRQQGLLS